MPNRTTKPGLNPIVVGGLMFLALLVIPACTVAALQYFHIIDLRSLLGYRAYDSHRGMVAIPVSTRTISAFARVEREDLADIPHDQQVVFIYRKPEDVGKTWITDYQKIVGRVMARDKKPGLVFSEADFLPVGTRPGIVAGIPPGMRAIVLEATLIRGLDELRIGDHFDLLTSEEVDLQGMQPLVRAGSTNKSLLKSISASGQGRTLTLVDDGVLVSRPAAVGAQAQPQANGALNQLTGAGGPSGKAPPKELAIAVSPESVTPLTEAISAKKSIYCVARSGLPEEKTHETHIPQVDPLQHVSVVETIRGKKFGIEAFSAESITEQGSPKSLSAPTESFTGPAQLPAPTKP